MTILVIFWSIIGDRMDNLGLIDPNIKASVNTGQTKFEVNIYQFDQNGHQLAKNRPDATLAHEH